jgi:hypothetical protein
MSNFSSLVAFFADALSIAIGAGALGAAVAGIVLLVLDGPIAIRGRMLDAPFLYPASRVSDDLARLFERRASDRSEISNSAVVILHPSRRERMAPRRGFSERRANSGVHGQREYRGG